MYSFKQIKELSWAGASGSIVLRMKFCSTVERVLEDERRMYIIKSLVCNIPYKSNAKDTLSR